MGVFIYVILRMQVVYETAYTLRHMLCRVAYQLPIYSGVLQVGNPIINVARGIFYHDTTPFICLLDGEVLVPLQ